MVDVPAAPRGHWAVTGIFLLLCIFFLEWAHQFLVPMTAAILVFFAAWPLDKRVRRFGLPSMVTAFAVTLAALVAVMVALGALIVPVTELLSDLPGMIREFQRDLGGAAGGPVDQLRDAAEAAEDAMDGSDSTVEVKVVSTPGLLSMLTTTAPALVAQIGLALVLLFFLIASGPSLVNGLVQATSGFADKRRAVETVEKVADRLGTYLGGITLINAGLGVVVGAAMWFWGLPNAAMFGFIAFLLNFVPILGAMVGALLAAIVGYNDTGELWFAVSVLSTYLLLSSLEAQFVTPYLISGRLRLNPAIVFVAVSFFAWIWSVIGMVVAVPILVAAKILLDEYPATQSLGRFIGAGRPVSDRPAVQAEK